MCVTVHVDWLGGGGGGCTHNFLKGMFFSMGIFVICVILYELKCKFLCLVIGRHGFLGWQDFLESKSLLEDRTSPGYSVSCTSCNLCKDDGVVHACAVCLTNSVGGGGGGGLA